MGGICYCLLYIKVLNVTQLSLVFLFIVLEKSMVVKKPFPQGQET